MFKKFKDLSNCDSNYIEVFKRFFKFFICGFVGLGFLKCFMISVVVVVDCFNNFIVCCN